MSSEHAGNDTINVPTTALAQIEWLKNHIASLEIDNPNPSHKEREDWLLHCGMPRIDAPVLLNKDVRRALSPQSALAMIAALASEAQPDQFHEVLERIAEIATQTRAFEASQGRIV